MWEYNNLEELYHHGILGMKWGRRKSKYTSKDYRRGKALKKKKLNQLSNKELTELNKRMDLENRYKDNMGRRNVGKQAIKAFTATATTIGAVVTAYEAYQKYGGKGKDVVTKLLSRKRG